MKNKDGNFRNGYLCIINRLNLSAISIIVFFLFIERHFWLASHVMEINSDILLNNYIILCVHTKKQAYVQFIYQLLPVKVIWKKIERMRELQYTVTGRMENLYSSVIIQIILLLQFHSMFFELISCNLCSFIFVESDMYNRRLQKIDNEFWKTRKIFLAYC